MPTWDPRWEDHDDFCSDCDLCRDSVPITLFHEARGVVSQATFHGKCFERLLIAKEVSA